MTCPVDCIHYVDWPELVRLEKEREGIDINFKAKLVGNDHDNAVNGMQVRATTHGTNPPAGWIAGSRLLTRMHHQHVA